MSKVHEFETNVTVVETEVVNFRENKVTIFTILGQGVTRVWVRVSSDLLFVACSKCGGNGQHWAGHVFDGICFKCRGSGRHSAKSYTEQQVVQRFNAAERKAAREEIERQGKAKVAMAKEAERQAKYEAAKAARAAESRFVDAEVGARVELTGKVVYTKEIEGQFGTSRLLIIDCGEGVSVKTFTSAGWAMAGSCGYINDTSSETVWSYDINKGSEIVIKATIKEHSEYNGQKSTLVARAALLEVK